ncbi:MAG: hypothetical protein H6646_06440 [Anaerolineales bacterium]|nr:hypothetical protein [Anaerolineae bacterium]MCB9141899.1 hypothetical protein [Anaerolineales bacterium]
MSHGGIITVVTTEEEEGTRGGPSTISKVTNQLSVDTLRDKFTEFMESLDEAFGVNELKTETGMFQLDQIQFSVELSATGDFKLLGSGVGVAAGTTLSFVMTRKT